MFSLEQQHIKGLGVTPRKKVKKKKATNVSKGAVIKRIRNSVDVLETDLRLLGEKSNILALLLRDQSRSAQNIRNGVYNYTVVDTVEPRNIIWATDNYRNQGKGYLQTDEMTINVVCMYKHLIQPRSVKSKAIQAKRTKDKAEVFTPSWVCNAQNNLIDEAWFGYKNVFNVENPDHTWTSTDKPIVFPKDKNWHQYITEKRLEITCGEAPYLVSRYDTTNGKYIPVRDEKGRFQRIGLLDRKFRIIAENVHDLAHWRDSAYKAIKSIYGFEWQGDNLLIARENILASYIDYYYDFCSQLKIKKPQPPVGTSLYHVAYIISWNIFQMDGMKYILPYSDQPMAKDPTAFDFEFPDIIERHPKGIYAKIVHWGGDGRQKYMLRSPFNFYELIKES